MKKQLISELIAGFLSLMFFMVSLRKLWRLDEATWDMNAQPLPNWMTPLLLWGTLLIHFGLIALLVADKTRLRAFYAAAILLLTYTAYIIAVMMNAFGFIPCSCTWINKTLSYRQTIAFNLFFLLLAVAGILILSIRKRIPKSSGSHSTESQACLLHK